jgi:hypothetical protein
MKKEEISFVELKNTTQQINEGIAEEKGRKKKSIIAVLGE